MSRTITRVALALALLSPSLVHAITPVASQDSLVAATLAQMVARGDAGDARAGGVRSVQADLSRLYAAREWAPLWTTGAQLTPAARATLASLTRVAERGLDADAYDVPRLAKLASVSTLSVEQRAEFDMMLSAATLRVLRALEFGRVDPTVTQPSLRIVRDSVDVAAMVTALVTTGAADSTLDAAEPTFEEYQALKRALAVYRARYSSTDSVAQARIAQIALTMERWRWLPRTFDVPPVIVNLPAYHLGVLGVGGAVSPLAMDVVVGSTDTHQTPILADTIRSIEFAPYWIVPLSIAKGELIPIAMRDPHVLTVNNYEIVNRRGQVVVPSVKTLKQVLAGSAYIRQLPGGTNALGRVKFLFPNAFDVYLHDSPALNDFQRIRRDQSHGCVRVADPRALAQWLLRDDAAWTTARIDSAMNGRSPTRVPLARGVPIYLFYATAVANADGGVQFNPDIYGLDAALAAQLTRAAQPVASAAETVDPLSPIR